MKKTVGFSRQRNDEKVVLIIHKHWYAWFISTIWFLLLFVLLLIIAIMMWSEIRDSSWLVISLLTVLFLGLTSLILYEYYDWYEDKIILTDQRLLVVDRQGYFTRQVKEISLDKIENVAYDVSGLISTVFRLGSIYIKSAADTTDIHIDFIHRPKKIQETITSTYEDQEK